MRAHAQAGARQFSFLNAQDLAQIIDLAAHPLESVLHRIHANVAALVAGHGEADSHVLGQPQQHGLVRRIGGALRGHRREGLTEGESRAGWQLRQPAGHLGVIDLGFIRGLRCGELPEHAHDPINFLLVKCQGVRIDHRGNLATVVSVAPILRVYRCRRRPPGVDRPPIASQCSGGTSRSTRAAQLSNRKSLHTHRNSRCAARRSGFDWLVGGAQKEVPT